MRGAIEGGLDQGLLEQALEAGVQIHFNCRVQPEEVDIVASGLSCASAFAVGYNFKTQAPDGSYVCLDDLLSPKCYAYLVIRGNSGTIATTAQVGQRGMQERLALLVDDFRDHVNFDLEEPRYFSASVGFNLLQTAQKNGRLYIGEAGGFQDLTAGFGLRIAMTSGYLAAHSILEGCDFDDLWHARLAPMLKATAVNRWILKLFGNQGYAFVVRYSGLYTRRGRNLLHRHYHPRWYTPLLWPLARRAAIRKYRPKRYL